MVPTVRLHSDQMRQKRNQTRSTAPLLWPVELGDDETGERTIGIMEGYHIVKS